MARPRKPTRLKVLEGNRGHRKLEPSKEPQPLRGAPECPAGLSSASQKLWASLVAELDRLGLISSVDGSSMEAAIRGYEQGVWADAQITKLQAEISAGDNSQPTMYRLSVLMSASKKGWQQWKVFSTEFGLAGPGSRSKLSVNSGPKIDPIESALCG